MAPSRRRKSGVRIDDWAVGESRAVGSARRSLGGGGAASSMLEETGLGGSGKRVDFVR